MRLWCALQSSPHLANAPLEGHALTFPLHVAVDPLARRGLRSATLLLQMRAAVDNRDVDRETALHVAAAFCNPPIVRLLLQKMADTNLKNRLGAAPLHFAAHSGDARVVCLLLEASATDLDARRSNDDPAHDGATPILLASEGNNVMIADRSSIRPPPFYWRVYIVFGFGARLGWPFWEAPWHTLQSGLGLRKLRTPPLTGSL